MSAQKNENDHEAFLYSKEVDSLAPKPGLNLGTLTFLEVRHSVYLRVIEGTTRDSLTFLGLTTNFEESKVVFFNFKGTFMDLLEQLPYSPYDYDIMIKYHDFYYPDYKNTAPSSRAKSPTRQLDYMDARVIFTKVGSKRDSDPDGALIQTRRADGGHNEGFLSCVKRGWCPIATVAVVGLIVGGIISVVEMRPNVRLKSKIKVKDVEVEIDLMASEGPSTAQNRKESS